MAITNLDKPTPSISNSTKINSWETWNTISTRWSNEIRTWLFVSNIINSFTDFGGLWSAVHFPWQDITPWLTGSNITNQLKP